MIAEKCLKNTDRMLRIVNEFLNYSHWKDDLWALNKKTNDVNACLCESATLTKGYAEKCKANIELHLDENISKMDFDYASILSVLENLISNAAKYSPEGEKIILSSGMVGHTVKIKVQDFGLGISEKDREKVFKPFALYSQENRAGIKGFGLGLSIAKKIIERHGGELNFESAEKKGTTFYFTLPI